VLKVLVISKFYLKHLKELVQKLNVNKNLNQFQNKSNFNACSLGGQKMHSNFGSNLKLEQSGTVGLAQTVLAKN
jgi:hypothetical protein